MSDIVKRLRELEGQTEAFAKNQHHSFVTTQQMARESAAACREAADTIERLLSEWRSACTMKDEAPKGGEHFLVFRVGGKRLGDAYISADQIGLARYVPDDREGWKLEANYQFSGMPTHWMPLPPSPPYMENER
jgi:hypothetical protein